MKATASATTSLPLGSGFAKNSSYRHRIFFGQTIQRPRPQCCASDYGVKATSPEECRETSIGRRTLIGLASVASGFSLTSTYARGAGLPPEEKPKLCNDECEKELENVTKGLDEGILGMKVGGKRRLYIPGSLAFPKGLNSAPGRQRVGANSPVIFDVSLEYIPGL